MVISANGSSRTLTPKANFTTHRLLVGNFHEAEECLREGLKEIGVRGFLRFRKPILHVFPKEMSEGGLSSIEQRVYRELGLCVGAKETVIHE